MLPGESKCSFKPHLHKHHKLDIHQGCMYENNLITPNKQIKAHARLKDFVYMSCLIVTLLSGRMWDSLKVKSKYVLLQKQMNVLYYNKK